MPKTHRTRQVLVPWTRLKSESVIVKLHRVGLILAPLSESEWDVGMERRSSTARKERALAALRPKPSEAASSAVSGWMERLTERVIDNLQVPAPPHLAPHMNHRLLKSPPMDDGPSAPPPPLRLLVRPSNSPSPRPPLC